MCIIVMHSISALVSAFYYHRTRCYHVWMLHVCVGIVVNPRHSMCHVSCVRGRIFVAVDVTNATAAAATIMRM